MANSSILRYSLLILALVGVLALGVNSCAAPEESTTASDTAATTTDDGGTTTITLATTLAGVIYRAITVKKKPKDHSIKYTSRTAKPTTTTGFGGITLASTLNFDNAQFGNSKFQ